MPSTFDEASRTVTLRWTTGAEVRRESWFDGPFVEQLSTDPKHVRLDRLNSGAALLDSHDSRSLSAVLGVVERAWLEDGSGYAKVRFSSRPEVEPVLNDVRDGILRNVSVGYQIHKTERDEGSNPPTLRVTDWEPHELSLVSVPADPGAQVRGAALNTPTEREMTTTPQAGVEPAADQTTDNVVETATRAADSFKSEAAKAKLEAQITRAAMSAGYPAEQLDGLLAECRSMEDATFKLLSFMKEKAEKAEPPAPEQRAQFTVTGSGDDSLVERMGSALSYRIKPQGQMPEEARDFRHASLLDMARACIEKAGGNVLGMSKRELATRAFHVSTDFADLFTSTAERSLLGGYEEEPHAWDQFCSRKDFRDFREVKDVALSASMVPTALREGGEYKARTIQVDSMAAQLGTYAQKILVTREMIVNDDLDALSRVPELLGRGCRTLEQNMVINLITSDAATAIDSTALFDAGHNNTGSGALSITSIADGVTAMRKQTDPAGERLNLGPAFLLVPAALELEARQLIAPPSYYPAGATGADGPNIYAGMMNVYVDARFDAASATQFYLVASPTRVPTIRFGYLEGESGPAIDPIETRDPDGLTLLCRHDFGVSLQDFRGFYRSTGA